eukprot:evm.model.scf_996.1 EVM.evm.TU.scf_996.1   scf_996:6145-15734(-)
MGVDEQDGSWLLGEGGSKREYPARNGKPGWGCWRCWWTRGRSRVACAVVGLLVVWALWRSVRLGAYYKLPFVKVAGTEFEADCRPFYMSGFNSHDLVQAALMTTYDYSMEGGKSGRDRIREMFSQAARAGLNVVRTWAHTNDKKFPFQEKPGKYSEKGFRALDYILDEARRHGMHVILSMVDNWKYYNGVDQYVDWSSTVPQRTRERPTEHDGDPTPGMFDDESAKNYEVDRHMLFFNDTDCKRMYKNHVKTIVNRRNHMNGFLYKEDPTILAYDLINEPRCEMWRAPECSDILQRWIEEMSEYLKIIDPDHLVTVGTEGFFGADSQMEGRNPQGWAGKMGQNFTLNHMAPHVDFATIHIWLDNWDRTDTEFQTQWLRDHIAVAASDLGKPVLLEEFGKMLKGRQTDNSMDIQKTRDPIYESTYAVVEDALWEQTPLAGSLYWRWNMPLFKGKGRGAYGVRPGDSTFQFVQRNAQYVSRLVNSRPPRAECSLGCWVPQEGVWGSRKCVNAGGVCDAYWAVNTDKTENVANLLDTEVHSEGKYVSLGGLQVFATREACCHAGRGAFGDGCSWF